MRTIGTALGIAVLASSVVLVPSVAEAAPVAAVVAPAAVASPVLAPTATTTPPRTPRTWPVKAGDIGPLVLKAQQRLIWLGYDVEPTGVMDRRTVKAVTAFRTKFFLGSSPIVSIRTWQRLKSLTRTEGKLPKACRTGLVLCIDKTQRSVRLVSKGKVVLTVDARFGGSATPTREGTFRVYRKSRDHVSSLFHTWMPFAMFFSGGQAVHYSPYFHRDGYNGASHGCVNLRSKAIAAKLFNRVPTGTRVVVYRS